MERKLFGHRRKESTGRVPGKPFSYKDDSYGKSKDNPPELEEKEHMKYRNPGFSRHEIRIPEDEPHMKSRVGKSEMHEMEDNYHMDTPDQTEDDLPAKIKRARMKMDAPNQQDPKPILGNLVRNVSEKGVEDTSGEEEMGPNEMQKETRKKLVASVMKRKMKKR